MKILGLITARGGSKGVPKKNIKLLGGHPLIAYTISVAQKSRMLDRVILSTDDEEIARVSREYGCEVPFMRPKELATDTVGHVPVIQHAVNFLEKKMGYRYDYIVLLQPTSPFRLVEDIDNTIKKIMENDADTSVSVVKMNDTHPLKAKKIVDGRVLPFFDSHPEPHGTRRQDLPDAYKRSGAVYVIKRGVIMEDNKLYGEKIYCHIVPEERSIDIDNELDWIKAEYMLKDLNAKGYTIFT